MARRETFSVRLSVHDLRRLQRAADAEPDTPARAALARALIVAGLDRLEEAQRARRRRAA